MKYKESAIGQEFRDEFLVSLLGIDSFSEQEISLNNRWGSVETYDHTRKQTLGKGRFGKCKNSPNGTFLMGNFRYRRVNNCAEDEEVGNVGNFEGNWDYRQYQGVAL